ncbi:MAG: hypothetical protein M1822_007333 [Bathelium mastoideum]|nr:MAG: hypothetical protein M1822_007333 [Bathelium mastoideum]
MAPFSQKKELITFLNGKVVCYDHHLRLCPLCCIDMTFDEEDEESNSEEEVNDDEFDEESHEESDEDFDEEFSDEVENPDQVFILSGETARLDPATDDQLVFFEEAMKNRELANSSRHTLPTKRPQYHYCDTCELTWVVGRDGEQDAADHPSHQTLFHKYAGTCRSLAVFTDGACSFNGAQDARAGIGVFFGKDSTYNLSEPLPGFNPPTSQKTEILAVVRALEVIYERVLPTRRGYVRSADPSLSESIFRDITHFRTVVVTDSSYVVEVMCTHLPRWTKNRSGDYINKQGKAMKNSAEFTRLLNEIESLAESGVQVAFYLVPREMNAEADRLAKDSLRGTTRTAALEVYGQQHRPCEGRIIHLTGSFVNR